MTGHRSNPPRQPSIKLLCELRGYTVIQLSMSVPPTSVEAEQMFSAAGVLCNKMHSQLVDSMLDRTHFVSCIRITNISSTVMNDQPQAYVVYV